MTAGLSIDARGGFSREIHTAIYTEPAIAAACSAFEGHCRTELTWINETRVLVTIHPNTPDGDLDCVLAFWNFVLNTEADIRFGGK